MKTNPGGGMVVCFGMERGERRRGDACNLDQTLFPPHLRHEPRSDLVAAPYGRSLTPADYVTLTGPVFVIN